jgi:transposase
MTERIVASLPKLPTGREFEELVGAVFQATGHFVERDLVEREKVEILQLDAIATDYEKHPPGIHLIEAKSGSWGFTDIFKIKGWMTHLNIADASLVTCEERDRLDAYQRLAKKVGVALVRVDNGPNAANDLATAFGLGTVAPEDVSTWRFCYWTERRLLERITRHRRTEPDARRFRAILDHAFEINSGVFFAETVAERVEALYATYGTYRNLAARCALEMTGSSFDTEDARIPDEVFRPTFYDCELNEVQAASWLEHRARLTLLKAAVDYLSYKQDGDVSRAERTITWRIGGKTFKTPFSSFPARFEQALAEIEAEQHFRRYPVVWQWFLGAFGGFFLKDYEESEVQALALRARIPPDVVPRALAAYDKLFPIEGGWIRDLPNSQIRIVLLYPVPFRGIGANFRRALHATGEELRNLKVTGHHTMTDLVKWNNSVVQLLTS